MRILCLLTLSLLTFTLGHAQNKNNNNQKVIIIQKPSIPDFDVYKSERATTKAEPKRPSNKYVKPNYQAIGVDSSKTSLQASDRTRLSNELTAYICNGNQIIADQAIRFIGLALILDPENKNAILSNVKLASNKRPTKIKTTLNAKSLAKELSAAATKIHKDSYSASKILETHILSVALELDKNNDDLLYQSEIVKAKPNWAALTSVGTASVSSLAGARITKGAQPVKNKTIIKKQAKIKGLMISKVGAKGQWAGMASDTIVSVSRGNNRVAFARKVGPQMNTVRSEALKIIQSRYPSLEPGYNITFSYGDKYTPKDGGSIGVALTMLMFSIVDGIEIDPDFAVTGDVTVDWTVRVVGGVPYKIRGAQKAGLKYVAVPKGNFDQVIDMGLLFSLAELWKIQIFTLDNIEEALETMRLDRTASRQEAIKIFDKVAAYLNKKGTSGLKNSKIKAALNKVVELAPNHASATLLLQYINRQYPAKLSANTGAEEMFTASGFVLGYAKALSELQLKGAEEAKSIRLGGGHINPQKDTIFEKVTDAELKSSIKRLNYLKIRMHKKILPLHTSIITYLTSIHDYKSFMNQDRGQIKGDGNAQMYARMYYKKLGKVVEDSKILIKRYDDLMNDQNFLEDIMKED